MRKAIPWLVFAAVATASAFAQESRPLPLLVSDALTSATPVKGESAKVARGGQFSPKGWRAQANGDFLMIEIEEAFGFEGKLEVDISELDWARANTAAGRDKIHFINMLDSFCFGRGRNDESTN